MYDKCPVDIDKIIDCGMVSVLNSNTRSSWVRVMVDQNTDYAIGVCCFSAMYASSRDKTEW